jgi:hypothetical protein
MNTDPLDSKSKLHLTLDSPLAIRTSGESAALATRFRYRFDSSPAETMRHTMRRAPGSADELPSLLELLSFENGTYKAKQEAQYGNLAIFQRRQRFFEFSLSIKTNSDGPL